MNKKPYAWLDGIPDTTTDLYNDAGFLNESEVEEKVDEGIDIDNATNGQILSCAVVGNVKSVDWIDPPSSGVDYSTTEQDTGLKWTDGKSIYQITMVLSRASDFTWESGQLAYVGFLPSISNLDTVVKTEGMVKCTYSGAEYRIPVNSYTNFSSSAYIAPSTKFTTSTGYALISMPSYLSLSSITYTVTVYYTKTS